MTPQLPRSPNVIRDHQHTFGVIFGGMNHDELSFRPCRCGHYPVVAPPVTRRGAIEAEAAQSAPGLDRHKPRWSQDRDDPVGMWTCGCGKTFAPDDFEAYHRHLPSPGLDVDDFAQAEHFWCVEVEGEAALSHRWEQHRPQAMLVLARLRGDERG